ncbi:hypothetical protein LTR86_005886 [Recurvomyces mirabilis]|nr:hypothetical protein LTR86_005886 [Recurvomyces mirabilis]
MENGHSTGDVNNQASIPGGVNTVCLSRADIEDLGTEGYNDHIHGQITWKTIFSSDRTPTDSMTAGIATCKPRRDGMPTSAGGHLGPHRHLQAETYYIISGEGIVTVDMIDHKVKAGSIVFIPGNAEHSVRNESLVEDLVWYYCFATDNFANIKYRFSNDSSMA